MINPNSDLAGVDPTLLQGWLNSAQQALQDLMIGGKPIQVSYAQSDGQKMVTYKSADMGQLRVWIRELQAALGINCGRQPMTPVYTSGSGYYGGNC